MVKGLAAAVAKLRADPGYNGRRTAADLFRETEPLDDTSAEEMRRAIRESRENARKLEATQEPPEL